MITEASRSNLESGMIVLISESNEAMAGLILDNRAPNHPLAARKVARAGPAARS